MPLYIIKNRKTENTQTIMCSWNSLQEKLTDLGEDWTQQIGAPALISHTGNIVNKTSSEFKQLLGNIKKGSDKSSTIEN
jgi:hypothetical protein